MINAMKRIIVILIAISVFFLGTASIVEARTRVRGYSKRSGTYVMPHYRSSPNRFKFDNWSSQGNYNPYTGRKGYVRW